MPGKARAAGASQLHNKLCHAPNAIV